MSDAIDTSRPRRFGPFAAMLSPTWLVLGLFFLLPLGVIFLISFARGDGAGGYEPVVALWPYIRSGAFLENYETSLRPLYLHILWRSVSVAMLTTVLCALISFPVAYFLAIRCPKGWKSLLLLLVVVPFWTSFLIRTGAWVVILNDHGLINGLLMASGLIREPLDLLYNDGAVMIGLVYGELPFMILPLYASLEKLDRSLLEASADLGAGGWATFRRITLPLSAPGLVAGTVLVFIPSIGQFVVSELLGGAKVLLVGNVVQSQFAATNGTSGDKPFGAAVAFELVAIVLLMLAVYARYARGRGGEDIL